MDKDRMDEWSRGLIVAVAVAVAVKDGWMDRKQKSREGGMEGWSHCRPVNGGMEGWRRIGIVENKGKNGKDSLPWVRAEPTLADHPNDSTNLPAACRCRPPSLPSRAYRAYLIFESKG